MAAVQSLLHHFEHSFPYGKEHLCTIVGHPGDDLFKTNLVMMDAGEIAQVSSQWQQSGHLFEAHIGGGVIAVDIV